jgi:hypothetical protein
VNRKIGDRLRIEDIATNVDLGFASGLIDDTAGRTHVVRFDRVDDVGEREVVGREGVGVDEHFERGLRRSVDAGLRDALILLERGNDLIIRERP